MKSRLLLLTTLLMVQNAYGAGFAVNQQSTSGMGTGFASNGVATADISAQFSNPASLANFSGNQFVGSVLCMFPTLEFKDGESSSVLGEPYPSEQASSVDGIMETSCVPALYGMSQVTDKINIGISFNVPWATKSSYRDDWVGRYYATDTEFTAMNLGIVSSYKFSEALAFGAGIQIQQAEGALSQAIDLGLGVYLQNPSAQTAGAVGNLDAIATFEGDTLGFGVLLGLTAKFAEKFNIGLGYRSKINHIIKGDMTFRGQNPSSEAVLTLASANNPKLQSGSAEAAFPTPHVINAGLSYDAFENTTLYVNSQFTTWSVVEDLEIKYSNTSSLTKLNFKDSFFYGLGGDHKVGSNTFRAGLAYDQGTTELRYRNPRNPGMDRRVLALGYGREISKSTSIDMAMNLYDYDKAELNLDALEYQDSNARGNLEGRYKREITLFMLQVKTAI